MIKQLLIKSKPYVYALIGIQILLVTLLVILTKASSHNLVKDIGSILGINIFIIVGVEIQMLILLVFKKSIMLEIYSTLLILPGPLSLIILLSNEYSVKDKVLIISILLTICVSGLYNRMIVAKFDMKKYQEVKHIKKQTNDKNKIII